MGELQEYVTDKSGSWSVGDEHLTMLAGFLANKDNCFAPNVPLLTLQILRGELLHRRAFIALDYERNLEFRSISTVFDTN